MKEQHRSLVSNEKSRPAGRHHAVVIGGSMAGLLAARVLADHFDRVTIIERDTYSAAPLPRKGVPQAHHLHALLARGLQIMEQFFPGLSEEMIAVGACELESGSDLAWLTPAGWGLRFDAGVTVLAFSRPLLDWVVRRRLQAFANVRFIESCEVNGLLADAAGGGVRGVALRYRPHESNGVDAGPGDDECLKADLVVDASGRASQAPRWLSGLGYQPPRETVVNAFLGYASRVYEIPRWFEADWKAAFLQAAPPERGRAAILFPIEGNRWMVTLSGGNRDYPPTDEAGFLSFVRDQASPLIYDAIRSATPVSPIYAYRATENRLRHYEQMARLPEGFILLGDAVCAFNPVYGQGMTVAALSALELDRALGRQQGSTGDRPGFARRFQKRLAKVNTLPWALATGEDSRYANAVGASPNWKTRLMHGYTDRIVAMTTHDATVRKLWLEVFQMLKPPSALFHPAILLRLLGSKLLRHNEAARATNSERLRSAED